MATPLHQHPGATPDGPWSTGLCDCFHDVRNCCITCWCPCITFGQVAEIVDQGTTSCVMNGAVYGLLLYLTGCGCLLSCLSRTKMRKTFGLQKSPCGDCCVHCWCDACALCQEYRELKNRGFDPDIGWKGNEQRLNNGGVAMVPPVSVSAPAGQYGRLGDELFMKKYGLVPPFMYFQTHPQKKCDCLFIKCTYGMG